jgi:hypothetical protein
MPRKNKRKSEAAPSPARLRVWKHNSFFGHARMMEAQCEGILRAHSVTDETREIAFRILCDAKALTKSLKQRRDL